MEKNRKVIYQNIEDALIDLNASDKGRYFMCTCPECEEREAFIYKNNLNFIQCNRQNECGARMIIHFQEKEETLSSHQLTNAYPTLTNKQAHSLEMITRYLKHMQFQVESKSLEGGYRGLSRKTTEPFLIDLSHPLLVKKMFEHGRELFPKNYQENDWMCKRNLVFPIYGEEGSVDRILLRSSIDPSLEPKEIQLIVNPSKETRDFFIDVSSEAELIVIGESVLDAASFREIDPAIGLYALTGAAKSKSLSDYLVKEAEMIKEKKFVIAPDDDIAGWRAARALVNSLEVIRADYQLFTTPSNINDPNQYLTQDYEGFRESFQQVKRSFSHEDRSFIDIKEKSDVIAFCSSRLDAISFRCVDSEIGIVSAGNEEILLKMKELLNNPLKEINQKKILLAMPKDPKGIYATKQLEALLKDEQVHYQVFTYPSGIKNISDFFNHSEKKFKAAYQQMQLTSSVHKPRERA
ncbi:toprim domain-containing protein [Pseudobacillus sp. 179-B 2D1 NHS]|uniref:toprim domain-containing protein n=1 Tax=Pseudobacillus sp. 179-B 2D1 NHS TaxID=3374292 RepID=UPI00387A6754